LLVFKFEKEEFGTTNQVSYIYIYIYIPEIRGKKVFFGMRMNFFLLHGDLLVFIYV
jgi:hypothetical protein